MLCLEFKVSNLKIIVLICWLIVTTVEENVLFGYDLFLRTAM